ncbi:uncharacterized protein LOC142588791 [Dermacentor variabilis]|uniref:uncharacterized protein LOC142588791 n=1 Tax=Dermacentor variabilis TaxID=34621 RepID=UPI003F5B8FED
MQLCARLERFERDVSAWTRIFRLLLDLVKAAMPHVKTVLDLLLRDGQQGVWKKQQDRTFQRSKEITTKAAVLVHFAPAKLVVPITDASPHGVQAILAHRDKDGQERRVSCASPRLHAAEQHQNQLDKDALALMFGVKRFHQYCVEFRGGHGPQAAFMAGKDLGPAHALSRHSLLKVHDAATEPGEVFTLKHTYPEVLSRSSVSLVTSRDPVLAYVVKAVSRGQELVQQAYSQEAADLSLQQRCLLWRSKVVISQSPVQGPTVAARGSSWCRNDEVGGPVPCLIVWNRTSLTWCRAAKSSRCISGSHVLLKYALVQPTYEFRVPIKGHSFLVGVDGFSKWVAVLPVPTPSAGTITAAQ